jgi:hypothetical protein
MRILVINSGHSWLSSENAARVSQQYAGAETELTRSAYRRFRRTSSHMTKGKADKNIVPGHSIEASGRVVAGSDPSRHSRASTLKGSASLRGSLPASHKFRDA